MSTETLAELEETTLLSKNEVSFLDGYFRATNYLAAAQIYLKDNCLLTEPLKPEHIKNRLLGHWGTAPGINFITTHLNRMIRHRDAEILLVTGPGHGAPANLANLFLEGSLNQFYPELTQDRAGAIATIKKFSIPGGNPSHLHPGTPGVIHEGGELGYALATAFGAAFDNPELVVACIVGDGEAETGPTATAWHCSKFLNPVEDGAVLPILHVNGYKISCPTVFGAMSDEELLNLFTGYGYSVLLVDADGETEEERSGSHLAMMNAMDEAFDSIHKIQTSCRDGGRLERPNWPMIILRSPKGWTGPLSVDSKQIEGSFRSHQVPAIDCKTNLAHLEIIEKWLLSYHPSEFFEEDGGINEHLLATIPTGVRRMGMNPHAYGGFIRRELTLPDFKKFAIEATQHGSLECGDMSELGKYLREVIVLNDNQKDFRIFCPDEMTSNRLGEVFGATNRQFEWPVSPNDDYMGRSGRVIEMLSEHNCQGWLQGYLLTGRHGLFPCYEAFAPIVDSMMNQFSKFLKVSSEISWRRPISSLTYLLTSEGWRQDHNGYSHQGPGFINNLLTRKAEQARVYLPPDTNCLLSTVDHCLTSTNKINLVIASKQKMPQWLTMDEAIEHCRRGASVWDWASTDEGNNPHVVLTGIGVYPMAEVMAAVKILREELPELRVRVVNVTDLLILEPNNSHPHGLSEEAFEALFTGDKPVILNFHGYPGAVKQLLYNRPGARRFQINGYLEEGTTTTPFDLMVRNRVSRFHLVLQALVASELTPELQTQSVLLQTKMNEKLAEHQAYICEHDEDMPEITDWKWLS